MIRSPSRRLWFYPVDGALEILLFGDEEEIAPLFAAVRHLAETWPGFDRVDAIAQGSVQLGVRVTLAQTARYLDGTSEGMLAIRTAMPETYELLHWRVDATGAVGTW